MTTVFLPTAGTHNTQSFSGTVAASTTVNLISEATAQIRRYIITQIFLLEPASGVDVSIEIGGETAFVVPASGVLEFGGSFFVDSQSLDVVGGSGTNPASYAVTVVFF